MSMNSFTCLTCRVVLPTAESQRLHYKEEWHSYNLKRKIAALPPVTHDHYSRIERLHQPLEDQTDISKTSFYCESCSKQFNNSKAFEQHISSKKHKNSSKSGIKSKPIEELKANPQKESNIVESNEDFEDDSDSEWESVDSDEDIEGGEPIASNECLFCDESSDTIEDNVCHMSQKHSFFIPDVEYLKDLDQLLTYLGEKVGFGHFCLWCCDSGKRFKSRTAAQQHMRDRGHTKMFHYNDSLLEYSSFYDYSKSYPDQSKDQSNDQPKDQHKSDDEEEVSIPHLDDSDWQLTLPSGAVIGHRSLFRYYKQNLKPLTDNPDKYSKSSAILEKVMSRYRSLGWTGITGEAALQRAKDIKFVHRIQRRHELKLGIKNNRNLQNHFRSQIGF